MVQKRSILWIMLFSGVVMHMLCFSNLNIAITKMVKLHVDGSNRTAVAYCSRSDGLKPQKEFSHMQTGDYDWSTEEKSVLLGSFSWFMGVAQVFGALLCQKYGGKMVFAISNLCLGCLSCLIPIAADFGVWPVIVIRVAEGILGSGVSVSANTLISKWVPPDERAKFVAILAGHFFGASFSYFFNGWVLHFLGWRYIFYSNGALCVTWCIVWHLVVYETPRENPTISSAELMYIENSLGKSLSTKKLPVPWLAIFTSVPVIVNTLVGIANAWTMLTFLQYIPTYLQEIHGFRPVQIGEFSSLPYLLKTVFAIGFAAFADMLLRRKTLSVTNIRKLATFVSATVSGVLFGCILLGGCNTPVVLALLMSAVMFSGGSLAGSAANVVDMSPNFCAIIHGLQAIITTSSGYVSPLIVEYFTGENSNVEQWNKVFLLTSSMNIVLALLFFVFADSKVQQWNFEVVSESAKTDLEMVESHQSSGQTSGG